MAPRGRTRKVGLKRMDAAIDALIPLGFSKSLIRRTVNALLKVYEGDSGWVFIEEASYKLLIETILEEQECLEKKDKLIEDEGRDTAVGTSNEVGFDPTCTEPDTAEQVNETADDRGLNWKDISCLDHPSQPKLSETVIPAFSENRDATSNFGCIDTLPCCGRKRCYGWIDSGDEEDLVYLTTVILLRNDRLDSRKERKSRWDVKPEGM